MKLRARQIRAGVTAGIGLAGALACAVLINMIATQRPVRLDLTRTGDHRLSERSASLLDRLDGDFRLVLAVDGASVPDARAFDRVIDTLHAIEDASPSVEFHLIDLASPDGRGAARSVVAELARRDAEAIEERKALLGEAAGDLDEASRALEAIAQHLLAMRGTLPETDPAHTTNRAYFEQRTGLLRVAAREFNELVAYVRAELDAPTGPAGLTDTDRFLIPITRAATGADGQLGGIGKDMTTFADAPSIPAGARDAAGPTGDAISALRDRLALLLDDLERAEPLDAIQVARALETGEILLVVGPPETGVAAVEMTALSTPTEVVEAAGVSATSWSAQLTEEEVASALGALINPAPPIVVLTHAESGAGVIDSAAFQGLRRRMAARGVELIEWATAVEPNAPSRATIDPAGLRPVVYVAVAPDSTAASGGQSNQPGTQRAARLGSVLDRLIADGQNVLLSANPSIFPTYGDTDPISAALAPFGLALASGTPLLAEEVASTGRAVSSDLEAVPAKIKSDAPHPIAEAIAGLPTRLSWAVPIETIDGADASVTSLVTFSSPAAWPETQWLQFYHTNPDQRRLIDQPSPGDAGEEPSPSYLLAAASTRADPATGRPQRLVVVGSKRWLTDSYTMASTARNRRAVLSHPGNIELLEAAVFYLAGQDELITRSTTAEQIATVRPLSASQLGILGWALQLALPCAVLVVGVASRLFFG